MRARNYQLRISGAPGAGNRNWGFQNLAAKIDRFFNFPGEHSEIMKKLLRLGWWIPGLLAAFAVAAADNDGRPTYRSELGIVYSTVDGRNLTLNAFLPDHATNPTPAIVDIHGGWFYGGEAASRFDGVGGGRRDPDNNIPNDSRPHARVLFHGVTPDTGEGKALYTSICPLGQVRKDVPPLLICDGERDPIVPGLEGKELYEKLQAIAADATYWMSPGGGHAYPSGPGFDRVLDHFITHSLKLEPEP
jgi:acetyl esterase/lipase